MACSWSGRSASPRSPDWSWCSASCPSTPEDPNDVAGFIYAALGVIYAVLLALVVIAVWEEYQTASETVEQEANALAEIFWLAHRLPEPEGTHLQELSVPTPRRWSTRSGPSWSRENPLDDAGGRYSARWTLIDDIRASLQEIEPRTPADEQLYAEGLDQVQRRPTQEGRAWWRPRRVPGVLWSVPDLRGNSSGGLHLPLWVREHLGTPANGADPGSGDQTVLFTIGAMEHPFSGGARIGTGAFELVLERFETSKLSYLR